MIDKKQVRIWIYQSSRFFSKEEQVQIFDYLNDFTKQWNAHGKLLDAQFDIKYGCFIILKVNENAVIASGCSIDSSVKIIKEIEKNYNISLFNRFDTVWKSEENLIISSKEEFESLINSKHINENTIVFNNTVQNLEELENSWEVPLKNSWHYNFYAVT